MTANGYGSPDVMDNYTRSYELCESGDHAADLFPVLWGLWQVSNAREKPSIALKLAEQVHTAAQASDDVIQGVQGHHAMWTTLMHCAQFEKALEHMEQGKQLYRPPHHHQHAIYYGVDDPGVCCLATGSDALTYLGYLDRAVAWSEEGVALAKTLERPFSLSFALAGAVDVYRSRHDFAKAFEYLEAWITVNTEHGFQASLAAAEMERGALLIAQEQDEAGIERLYYGLELFKSIGTLYPRPWFRLPLATAYGRLGQIDKGLAEIQHSLQYIGDTGQVKVAVELYRIEGTLLLSQAVPDEQGAEARFRQALNLARRQKAWLLELRVVMHLAQLWHRQGKRAEALTLLVMVYSGFTEGYGTGEL